jgi:hypothetical protein
MPMSPEINKRIPAALLILQFFLAIFLLQWSVEKLILPDSAARTARSFYGRRDDFPIHDAALLRINGHHIRIYEQSVSGLASRGAGLLGQRDIFAILRAVGCEHGAHV